MNRKQNVKKLSIQTSQPKVRRPKMLGRRVPRPSESSSDPAVSPGTTPLHGNTQPLHELPELFGDSMPDTLESCVENNNVEASKCSTRILPEMETCFAEASRMLTDGQPTEMKTRIRFVADMLMDLSNIIKGYEQET
jgi:hypothetical protein